MVYQCLICLAANCDLINNFIIKAMLQLLCPKLSQPIEQLNVYTLLSFRDNIFAMQTTHTKQLTIKHIQKDSEDESPEKCQEPQKCMKTVFQSPQTNPQTNQSYRYFRYKKLTIKHIEKDSEDQGLINYYQPQTCMETVFHQPIVEDAEEKASSRKVSRCKQIGTKNIIQNSQPGINNRWQFARDKNLSQKCIEKLRQEKKEVYNQLVKCLELFLKKQSKKCILYIYGQKETGKKTLLYQALNNIIYTCQKFYLNFSIASQKSKQQILSLYKKLQTKCRKQASEQQEIRNVLVVNNVQTFIFFLKKAQIYHEFKVFMKTCNLLLVLVDRVPLDSKQLNWIAQNSQTMYVPKNSKQLFLSSLVDYFADYKKLEREIVLLKPLANYFTVKLYEQNCLQIGIIQKFAHFVHSSINSEKVNQKNQYQEQTKTIKVTRQHIESFKKSSFGNKCTVELQQLNLHEKIILVACYIYLTENQQIAIPFSLTQKNYKWACVSLSVEAKQTKQLQRDVLYTLETYRLLKVVGQLGLIKEKHILLNIDLCRIKDALSNDPFLHKFFSNNNKQQ